MLFQEQSMRTKSVYAQVLSLAFILSGIVLMPGVSAAATAHVNAFADANITGTTVNQYPPSLYSLNVNVFDNTRAILEFHTNSLPAGAVIDSLNFNFNINSVANQTSTVNVFGFPDNGLITAADATASATQLGSY